MGIADRNRKYWTADWAGRGVSIDDLVDAFMGGDTVYADRQLVVTRTLKPLGLQFSGEIDVTNRDAVGTSVGTTSKGDVHLDVSGLIFCDISGIRAFVEAAEHRDHGRLLLHGLPELLQTVIRVTGWAELPNLVICTCRADSQ